MKRTAVLRRASFAFCAVTALGLLSGCSWFMGKVSDDEIKELDNDLGKPDPRLSAYDNSLVKFGRMLEAYNIKQIRVQSKLISNYTADQSLPQDVSKMLDTAINKIGRQVVYIPFDPNYVISEATTGGNINRALPEIVITGGITEYDKDMIEKSREAKADGQVQKGDYGSKFDYDAGAGYKAGSSTSRIAMDMSLLNYTNQAAIAGIQTSNAITVRKSSTGWGVGAYFQGCGLSFDYALQKKQGVYYALRLLVELSVIEVLGKYFDVPYWRCIDGAKPDVSMIARMTEEFNDLPQPNQIAFIKEYLFLYGYEGIDRNSRGLSPQESQALQAAMTKWQASSNTDLFMKLWADVPIEEARKRNKEYQKAQEAVARDAARRQAEAAAAQPPPAPPPAAAAPAPAPVETPVEASPAPAPKPLEEKKPAKTGKEAPIGLGPTQW